MPTPYEEISKNYSNRENIKTDANLSQDSMQLGGIDAEEYATEKYVQDYHGAKEVELKRYIDEQDKAKLEEAKAYSDTVIRNIDFSPYATDDDLNAVKDKLQNEINENETNINSLNTKYDELFQSVSDGKTLIAEAITDKGVETSATDTFENMSDNIRNIQTGGSGGGGLDTSDATATSSDILLNKTAYARGRKIVGNYVPLSIEQITPTIGVDTTGCTATEEDIAYGKTAYANGQYLVGTLRNTEVEEIYTLEKENYIRNIVTGYTNTKIYEGMNPDGTFIESGIVANCTGAFAVSKDSRFIARAMSATVDGETRRYIFSNVMSDEKIYVSATQNAEGTNPVLRKYVYTFEELGLDPNTNVSMMCIGRPGFRGISSEALLAIVQGNSIHFYIYDVGATGYGYIGKQAGSTATYWHWSTRIDKTVVAISAANTRPEQFVAFSTNGGYSGIDCNFIKVYENTSALTVNIKWYIYSYGETTGINCCFSSNDTYVQCNSLHRGASAKGHGFIIKVNKNGSYSFESFLDLSGFQAIAFLPSETQVMISGYLYDLNYSSSPYLSNQRPVQYLNFDPYTYSGFSANADYFWVLIGSSIYIYEVNFEATGQWTPIEIINMSTPISFGDDMSFATGLSGGELIRIRKNVNPEDIIGVKYKDQYFYKNGGVVSE